MRPRPLVPDTRELVDAEVLDRPAAVSTEMLRGGLDAGESWPNRAIRHATDAAWGIMEGLPDATALRRMPHHPRDRTCDA
jgi:hypothetical protein